MAWEPDYVTAAELKSYLRITDADDDVLIAVWATTASRSVDTFCHRQFGQVDTAEVRVFSPCWDRGVGRYAVEIDDLQDVTGLILLDVDANPITDYEFGPVNAPQKGKPYERLYLGASTATVTIEALWGWSDVPVPVKNASLLQAARLAARRDSPFGIAGSPSEGGETRLLATLDPDLKTSLGKKYRREWWAV